MLRFWPWKRDDGSPASFEKTLSALSERIATVTNRLESQRQTSRRFKALWTLYTSILYLIYATILAVAVGWRNWRLAHFGALFGGPFIIYAVRYALTAFYNYRTTRTQTQLESLQKQRDTTIEKLKIATKFDSTQQLLAKYSGSTPKSTPSDKSQPQSKRKPTPQGTPVQRTGIAPPPTANIPGRKIPSPQPQTPSRPPQAPQTIPSPGTASPHADFAPNAFDGPLQYSTTQPNWYDRLFDLLLGEDEAAAKNRIALICQHCRLVNGQAPPGVKSLEQLGKWRCSSCGGWNGEENEAKRLMTEMKAKKEQDEQEGWTDVSRGDEDPAREGAGREKESSGDEMEVDEDLGQAGEEDGSDVKEQSKSDEPPVTRSKAKSKGAKQKS